jgi:hypothetical protein
MGMSLPVDNATEEEGQGWVNVGDLPGAKSDGEQEVVYHQPFQGAFHASMSAALLDFSGE